MSATLQQLVNAAPVDGQVAVPAGTYTLADIGKTVHVQAATGAVVDAAGAAGKSAVRIHGTAPQGSIVGLAVKNATPQNYAGVMVDSAAAPGVGLEAIDAESCCFGIRIYGAARAVILGYASRHNAVGIGLWNAGGHLIDGFEIDDCDRMVVNDTPGGNDNGGNGFQLSGLQDGQQTIIRNGSISRARAQSIDYGVDGGAFELFAAADVLIQHVETFDCVNAAETGTNPGKGDCARIFFEDDVFHGRDGLDHTQNAAIACNGIIARNLVDSHILRCVFEHLDWWCIDFTQGSKYDGSGTRNVEIAGCQFFLREGVDRMYSFGATIPAGVTSHDNEIIAPPTATLARLNGIEYPATQAGLEAWQVASGLELGSTLYTPEGWQEHLNPPPPPPPVVPPLPDPDALIAPIVSEILGKTLQPVAKHHDERAAINALCKAYRAAYERVRA